VFLLQHAPIKLVSGAHQVHVVRVRCVLPLPLYHKPLRGIEHMDVAEFALSPALLNGLRRLVKRRGQIFGLLFRFFAVHCFGLDGGEARGAVEGSEPGDLFSFELGQLVRVSLNYGISFDLKETDRLL
jgi:hypothetical protein